MARSKLEPGERLRSLDAYRGFIMLVMASGGFAFAQLRADPAVYWRYADAPNGGAWRAMWDFLAFQFSHVEWCGCSFWDLIQPSFMFMVGVAMPYSFARRVEEGHSRWARFGHVLLRSLVLVLLGVFLSSNEQPETNYTFVNVLTQIGLGYWFVYLLVGRGFWLQLAAIVLILGGYWYVFYQYHYPPPGFNPAAVGLPDDWPFLTGLGEHWNKNANWAHFIDARWQGGLLNFFPRSEPFLFNKGGYQTFNFIPSAATMIFGLMTGEMLRSALSPGQKAGRLFLGGLLCLLLGMAADPARWPLVNIDFTLCPLVKRIWTPSWAVYSTGWTLWMLGAFYWIIDVQGWKRWSFPLAVVGMNSIAIYVMSQLMKGWLGQTALTHFRRPLLKLAGHDLFTGPFGPLEKSVVVLFLLWLICLWMYRQKIFVRI